MNNVQIESIPENKIETGKKASPSSKDRRPNPLVQLTLARVREFLRQPEAVFWVVVFPILMSLALGIAFRNSTPQKVRVAIDSDTPNAQVVAATISKSPELDGTVLSPAEAARELRTGKVAIVIKGDGSTTYQFKYDQTRPESQTARFAANDILQRAAGRADVAKTSDSYVSEPGSRYIDFLIPGLIGMGIMGTGIWGICFSIVDARQKKLLKRLVASPMKRSHYMLSHMFSRIVFLILEVGSILGFGYFAFGVKMYGSILSFAILSFLGAMAFAGIGLLIAARPKTIEGVSGLMNLVMLPMWLLSGTFFSATRFPDFVQPFIRILPLTAINESLRSVMNEGAGLSANLFPIGVLVTWGILSFIIALKTFRWQ